MIPSIKTITGSTPINSLLAEFLDLTRPDNIKMDLGEVEWDGMDWIDLSQDRGQ
jgi:hypothetical protein